jgi:threonine aldolase
LHLDGARFANAVAALRASPAEIIRRAGADVLCLGGSKIGLPVGEAVLFFNEQLAGEFAYRCKQAGQLASKMRFLTAPWLGLLNNENWLRLAEHANNMAELLTSELAKIAGAELIYPVQANAVFVSLPAPVHIHLAARGWQYYTFIGQGAARFMCSWATTEADVRLLVGDIGEACCGVSEINRKV